MSAKRYVFELGGALLVYAALLGASIAFLKHTPDRGMAAQAVALTPAIGLVGACWAIVRQLGRIDELQRRIQLESLSIAFAGTAMLTFSYGFLEGLGFPKLSMFTVWPLMAVLWLAGLFLSRWRYR